MSRADETIRTAGAPAAGPRRGGRPEVEAIYPLSPTQRGLLFHSLASPGAYYQRIGCELHGALDPEHFEGAWQDVLDRHPALRTGFAWEGRDEPLQLVGRRVRVPFRYEDWRGLPAAERRRRLRDLLREDEERSFDPTRAPLLRVGLVRLEEELFHFFWSHHHLILDGWSASRVLGEAFLCYRGRQDGDPPRLEPPRPYRDFIAWLRRRDPAASEAFWRGRLAGIGAPTPLPAERQGARPPDLPGHATRRRELAAELSDGLIGLARRHGLTLNTVVQGLWALALGRHAGVSSVVHGTTFAGRPADLEGSESMIGLFITTLPVRVDLPSGREALAWLRGLQAELAEVGQHEHVPLVDIHRWTELPPGTQLFESLVVFENYPMTEAVGRSGRSFDVREIQAVDRAHYPMTLDVLLRPGLTFDLTYERKRFEPTAVERLLGHLEVLAAALVDDPRARLGDLPVLTEAERQALRDLHDATTARVSDEPAHLRFERLAARWPERVAVSLGSRRVTYGELARRAARLAGGLAAAGVDRGAVVPILARRGPDLLAAVLAVLRAGGAFLPLDPDHPPARSATLVRRSGARVLLADASCRDLLASEDLGPAEVLAPEDLVRGPAVSPPPAAADPDDLAYVIYTSGSTGEPKGAMVTHRGMANHLLAKIGDLGLGEGDTVAQNASQSFDVSVWQLLAPPVSGGEVRVFDPQTSHDPPRLMAGVERHRVTVLETVPSLLRAALDIGIPASSAARSPLRWLVVTGEALPPDLCRRWLDLFAGVPMVNAYGPTECSDDVSHHRVARPPAPEAATVPIGSPVRNARLYVADGHGRLLPFGVAGELRVGGTPVGRGYLGDPGRTASAFVPDPFTREPGARAYRTGDLVRRSPRGTLDFLGRLDHQLKVRGFRIEPAEVESALRDHPAVADAVLAPWPAPGGGLSLVAYVVPSGGAPEAEELKRHLGDRLPDFMVPAVVVFLERLPLNENGKVDRAALPAPDPGSAAGPPHVPPRSDTERTLARIWGEILGRDTIGVHDDFFALGGHSLTATQLVARIRRGFGVDLTLADFFRTGSLEELAAEIEAALVTQADPDQIDRLLDSLEGAR